MWTKYTVIDSYSSTQSLTFAFIGFALAAVEAQSWHDISDVWAYLSPQLQLLLPQAPCWSTMEVTCEHKPRQLDRRNCA